MSEEVISKLIELDPNKRYIFTLPNATIHELAANQNTLQNMFPDVTIAVCPVDIEFVNKPQVIDINYDTIVNKLLEDELDKLLMGVDTEKEAAECIVTFLRELLLCNGVTLRISNDA